VNAIVEFIKSNIKVIMFSILLYQIFLTIFFFSTENLILLAVFISIVAGYIIISTYKDDILGFFKK